MDKDTLQKQVNIYRDNLKDLDETILRRKELIELLKAEAVIGETQLEKAYEDLHEATGQYAIEENKFQRINDELGLLFCKEAEKLPKPDEITDDLHESCTCDTYEWSGHTCPSLEDLYDDHMTLCYCCPFCVHQCYMDT